MTLYQWCCLLGIPALVVAVIKCLRDQGKKKWIEIEAVKAGVQALLRSQMVADYNKWEDRGFAPIYARENFNNCWQQYHNLGANGVMDDLRAKFLALPTDPPENRKEG